MMKNPTLRFAFLGAVTVIAFYAILYTVRKDLFLNLWVQWLPMLLYVFFMYKASEADIATNGTARDFREIVRTPFTVFLLINLGYWLFYYAIHLADTELITLELKQQLVALQIKLAQPLDVQERQQMMQFQADIEKEMAHPVAQPIGPIVSRMAMGAIGGFGLAAGIATILKNRQ